MIYFLLSFLLMISFTITFVPESFAQDNILEHLESFPIIDSQGVPHNTYFVHTDANNNYYLVQTDVNKIVKLDPKGKFLLEFGGRSSDPGEFGNVKSIAIDSKGNLYVTDANPNYRIQKFDSNGQFLSFFAEDYTQFYESKSIAGIEIDSNDNVYVSSNGQIIKFDLDGNILQVFGIYGSYVGESRPFSDIAIDSKGNIYGADPNLRKIVKFSPDGKFLFEFGVSINLGHTIDPDEVVYPGEFMSPTGIAIDSKDNLYVVDSFGDSLQIFNSEGEFAHLLGGNSESIFHAPSGVTVTKDDDVIVVDTNNLVIRKFNLDTTSLQYTKMDEKKFRTIDDVIGISINETFFHYGDSIVISAQSGQEMVIFDPNNKEIVHLYGDPTYEIQITGDLWNLRGIYRVEVSNSVSLDRLTFFVDDVKNPNVFEPRIIPEPKVSPSPLTKNTEEKIFDVNYLYRVDDDGLSHNEFSPNNPIAINSQIGQIILGDVGRHRIEIFSNDWESIHMFGGEGFGNGRFAEILDIATNHKGIYVLDKISDLGTTYNRIQKFDSTGKFLHSFAIFGTSDKKYDSSTMIDVDHYGHIYVADFSQIKKYNPEGVLIHTINSANYDGLEFSLISDIVIFNRNLYVIDSDTNQIHVFSSSGEHFRSFGNSQDFGTSVRMAVYNYGHVLVTAYSNNEILLYSNDGILLTKFSNADFGLDNYTPTQIVAYRNKIFVEDDKTTSLHVYSIKKQTGYANLGIADFVNPEKDPRHYVDRYNNEEIYKQWFDEQYPQYSSINQAVGLSKLVLTCPSQAEVKHGVCTIILNDDRKPSKSYITNDWLYLNIFSNSFRTFFPLIVFSELLISLAVYYIATVGRSKIKTLSASGASKTILSIIPFTSFYAFARIGRFNDALLLIIPIKLIFAFIIIVSWDLMIPYIVYFISTLFVVAYFMKRFSKKIE